MTYIEYTSTAWAIGGTVSPSNPSLHSRFYLLKFESSILRAPMSKGIPRYFSESDSLGRFKIPFTLFLIALGNLLLKIYR
jgi:hypothetical protein